MRRSKLLLAGFLVSGLCCFAQQESPAAPALIPKPAEMSLGDGHFLLTKQTVIVAPELPALRKDIALFNDYLSRYYQITLRVLSQAPDGNYIRFEEPANASVTSAEGYDLSVDKREIRIRARSGGPGFFYACQSLAQLLPADVTKPLSIPCLHISDSARFSWRGMHLDVCRHFFPVAFVKRYIDLLALYKMNTFHWHLTDDQGWRIEIKSYPRLTQTGAWRSGTMKGHYTERRYDSLRYGGYYTQDEVKEVVAYAAARHISIVPEIEMPGHSVAAIASYPWLSCTGKQLEVEKGWGVFEDVFCTKDSVFTFLEKVLDEVVALFPGKYIHIGGDESPKTRWKACPLCQSVIRREKLKDEHELQSYFIKRIASYINGKGREVIGWDEILEGGLAPRAAVMSWQGQEGGLEAARQKHPVVMSPVSHCYFDYYQAPPAGEPIAIGGYTPLEKVYGFEPVPSALKGPERNYILGAQGNVWTEYIGDDRQIEYMALPRMAALAEVLWTPVNRRNETDFLTRIQTHFALLDVLGYRYSRSLYQIGYSLSPAGKAGAVLLQLQANPVLGEVRYTTDGSEPGAGAALYTKPILIDRDLTVKSTLYQGREAKGRTASKTYAVNKATNAQVTLNTKPHPSYSHGGGFTLVNGECASLPRVNDQWLGWRGADMQATVQLAKAQRLSEVQVGFLHDELSWIYFPRTVEIYTSEDGRIFKSAGSASIAAGERFARLSLPAVQATYIKIVAVNHGQIPAGNPGAGEDAWLFCDEIMIR